jgi:hypothetical protein
MLFLLGWAMQHAAYLFLERDWEKDQERIKSILSYYKSSQLPISVRNILFI